MLLSLEETYFQHLSAGRFMLQRSRSTGSFVFYPRIAAPGSGASDLEWVEASGQGTVYAHTLIRQKPPLLDYAVVIVELAEGPRLVSRIEGLPADQIRIGLPVRAAIVQEEGQPVLVFRVGAS